MKWIKPSEIEGTITAPPSKSMTLRATAMALLSKGESQIHNYSVCDDALAGFRIAKALGAQIIRTGSCVKIKGKSPPPETTILDCGESGLCMRMYTPLAGLFEAKTTLIGTGSLLKRPMGMLEHPLKSLGAQCRTDNGLPPVQIQGPIKGGKLRIDGSASSQFLTGLLMALPLCKNDSEVIVDNLKSKPYVLMTLSLLRRFGISIDQKMEFQHFCIPGIQSFKSQTLTMEGDWSGASFFLVAGAAKGRVTVRNLQPLSDQADRIILEVLESAKARISIANDTVTVEESDLKAFRFDATESPDLFPPLAILASLSSGRSVIYGVDRLRHKESNRAQALLTGLSKIGANITIESNKMIIKGTRLTGGSVDSRGDHRIAMAGAIAGLNSAHGVGITDWKCVSKSYPCFLKDLKSIGGDVK